MGRPSKLDERQRAEIQRRLAVGGEGNSVTELAAEFRVGKATISRWFSKRTETVQTLANTLATTERAIEALPVSEQVSIRTLADQLKGIQNSVANVAAAGARTADRLQQLAEGKAKKLGDMSTSEDLKPIAALVATANEAVKPALTLVQAQKGKAGEAAATLEDLVTGRASGE